MSARVIVAASITVPLDGKALDADGIVRDVRAISGTQVFTRKRSPSPAIKDVASNHWSRLARSQLGWEKLGVNEDLPATFAAVCGSAPRTRTRRSCVSCRLIHRASQMCFLLIRFQ